MPHNELKLVDVPEMDYTSEDLIDGVKQLEVKSAAEVTKYLLDTSKHQIKPKRPLLRMDGYILVISDKSYQMEPSELLIERRTFSNYAKESTLLLRS